MPRVSWRHHQTYHYYDEDEERGILPCGVCYKNESRSTASSKDVDLTNASSCSFWLAGKNFCHVNCCDIGTISFHQNKPGEPKKAHSSNDVVKCTACNEFVWRHFSEKHWEISKHQENTEKHRAMKQLCGKPSESELEGLKSIGATKAKRKKPTSKKANP